MITAFTLIALASTCVALEQDSGCPPTTIPVGPHCEVINPYPHTTRPNPWKKRVEVPIIDRHKAHLGKLLFFDPVLSRSKEVSCAHCHHPDEGFAEFSAFSRGENNARTARNSPTVWNAALLSRFFWDGRSHDLADQIEGPLFHPEEMAMTEALLVERLMEIPEYVCLFQKVYGGSGEPVTLDRVKQSIAEFERTLIDLNTPFDRFFLGDETAMSALEIEGFTVFRSFATRCSECHTPPLFTNQQMVKVGSPGGEEQPVRVPTLRNIRNTAPYMHRGQFETLEEVVDFYNEGGGRSAGMTDVHWHVREIGVTAAEKTALLEFLSNALTSDVSKWNAWPEKVPSGLKIVERK